MLKATRRNVGRRAAASCGTALLLTLAAATAAAQQVAQEGRSPGDSTPAAATKRQGSDTSIKIEIYGFAMADAIFDFGTNDPLWFDVNRPSKLPAVPDQFSENGHTWLSARQTRFGTKATIPTSGPPITVVVDWDLFGVGVDAGQTTIRPRHMYGQWGKFGAGQTESPFMDLDVFPNILEYWGPNGMLFFRNVQFFWEPINKPNGTRVIVAIERPGASGDQGVVTDREELEGVVPRFPLPDFSATYRYGADWGYVKFAGMLRFFSWDDLLRAADTLDLGGHTWGGGFSVSGGWKATKHDLLHLQLVYGAGVENYFNDAPVDIGIESNFDEPRRPFTGKALPDFGMVVYLDHTWSDHFTSSIGYSRVDIQNSDLQSVDAFRHGQYASVNLLWSPVKNVLMGGEYQWGFRQNNGNGFSFSDNRLQFSAKYSFSQTFGGKQ